MKLELKNIKFGHGSEETTQFVADLYVNGKHAAHCDNAGKGGCTDIRGYKPGQKELIEQAEAYCKTLPNIDYGGKNTIPMNLENWVDEEIEKVANIKHTQKEQKRVLNAIKRECKTKIVIINQKKYDDFLNGKILKLEYEIINLKNNLKLFNQTELKKYLDKVKAQLKDGEIIFNTNLPV